eukprot:PhF_6_TR18449/c0_g1_i1/m.27034
MDSVENLDESTSYLRKLILSDETRGAYVKAFLLLELSASFVLPMDVFLNVSHSDTVLGCLGVVKFCKIPLCHVPHRRHYCGKCNSLDSDHFARNCKAIQ